MIAGCSQYQQHIQRSLADDLTAEEQLALNQHLAGCASCRAEHDRYAHTLQQLQSYDEEPLPRHFFVYPEELEHKPWQLFHRLTPFWQTATASLAALLLMVGVAAIIHVQFRSDHGAWTLSFGRTPAQGISDLASFKADILKTAEQKNQEAALAWIQGLRDELERTHADVTQEQKTQLVAALSSLETRVDDSIAVTANDTRTATQKSLVELYQMLSQQREHDLNAIDSRFRLDADSREVKARETDVILDTLIQVANLNLKQPGEQK
jgi:predicted anti-sigma-YlaC factor YlaD